MTGCTPGQNIYINKKHTQEAPVEQMLLEVYHKYLKPKSYKKSTRMDQGAERNDTGSTGYQYELSLQQVSH